MRRYASTCYVARMVAQIDNGVLYTRDVADLLGLSVSQVNRLAAEGSLPVLTKAPGLRGPNVFDRAAVEALARKEAGTA